LITFGQDEDTIEAGLFMTPRDPDRVNMLVAMAKSIVERNASGAKVEARTFGNVQVTEVFAEDDPTGRAVSWVRLKDTFVLAIGPRGRTMPAILARWNGEVNDCLGRSPDFLAVQKRVGARKADFMAYVSVKEAFMPLTGRLEPGPLEGLQTSGLLDVRSLCYRLDFDGPAFRDIFYIYTGPDKRGLVAAFSPAPLDEKLLKMVPAKSTCCVVSRTNLPLLWQSLDSTMMAIGQGPHQEFRQTIGWFSTLTKLDIEKDVVNTYGDYAVIYNRGSVLGAPFYGVPDWVAILGITNEKNTVPMETHEEAGPANDVSPAPASARRNAIQWQSMQYKNAPIHYLANVAPDTCPTLYPSCATVDGRRIFGLSLLAVQQAVDGVGWGKGIRHRPDFAAAWSQVPRGAGFIAYADMKACWPPLYGAASMVMNRAFAILPTRNSDGQRLDMSKFPPPEIFMKHLFGGIVAVYGEKDGIAVHSYSPVSANLVLAAIAMGTALSIPNMHDCGERSAQGADSRLPQMAASPCEHRSVH
jgi:hypothetical protein